MGFESYNLNWIDHQMAQNKDEIKEYLDSLMA